MNLNTAIAIRRPLPPTSARARTHTHTQTPTHTHTHLLLKTAHDIAGDVCEGLIYVDVLLG